MNSLTQFSMKNIAAVLIIILLLFGGGDVCRYFTESRIISRGIDPVRLYSDTVSGPSQRYSGANNETVGEGGRRA
ncbi:hypothetical protein D3C73_1456930 [compost metagenome]